MIGNKMNILDLLRQGENASIEFKESLPRSESIAKEIIAFANTQGGTLLIGVTDDAKVCGVLEEHNVEEFFSNIARNNVIPAIDLKTQVINYEHKKLINPKSITFSI